jgi:hypothetical protein
MNLGRVFQRKTNKKTVNGKNVYKGLKGGLYTANRVPVYFINGFYTTNKNFNSTAYMNNLRQRAI